MSTPEGWYDDGSGRTRWWDGGAWTEYYADTYAEQTAVTAQVAAASPGPQSPVAQSPASQPPTPQPTGAGFPVRGWIGVAVIVGGVIVFLIGRGIYYSDPYYNNTTDPVGIGTMVVGGIVGFVGVLVARSAYRSSR